MKDILFINTADDNWKESSNYINLGILSLATILKNNNYNVQVIDFNYLYKENVIEYFSDYNKNIEVMSQYILKLRPKIVDFYTMSNSYATSLLIAKNLKENSNDIKVVLGGPQASLTAMQSMKSFPWIDAIGVGEGERVIKNLVSSLLEDKNFNNVKGVVYRKNNTVYYNGDEKLIEDLDSLPMLDYSLVNVNKLIEMPLDVGRGCPFGCTYCSTKTFWKRYFRLKSSERIIKEIKFIIEQFGINNFSFVHDIFTVNKAKVIEFCNLVLKNNINIKWTCSARIDTLDEEMIIKMRESGCKAIYLGIETGSKRMQKIINKNLNLNNIEEKIKILFDNDIELTTSFIYGFPEERMSDIRDTLSMINILRKNGVRHTQLHLLSILPGTEMYERIKDKLIFSNTISDIVSNKNASNISKELITNNKSIFCQYLDFKSKLRNKLIHLDKFISIYYSFLFNNMNMTYKLIMENYKDLLDLFLDFKKLNPNAFSQSNNLLKVEYTKKTLETFIYSKIFNKNAFLIREIFKFELNIFNFMYLDESNEKIYDYEYNVYDIKNKGILTDINIEDNNKIRFTRIKKCRIRLDKIVS